MESSEDISKETEYDWQATLRKVILAGYLCIGFSSFCLYMSFQARIGMTDPYATIPALWMMGARLAGMGAFAIGALSVFNRRWTHGVLLFLGSLGLPLFSLLRYGQI